MFERLIIIMPGNTTRRTKDWIFSVEIYHPLVFQNLFWEIERNFLFPPAFKCILQTPSLFYQFFLKLELSLNCRVIQMNLSSVKYPIWFPILLWNYLLKPKDINYFLVNLFFSIKYYRYLWDLQQTQANIHYSCWE